MSDPFQDFDEERSSSPVQEDKKIPSQSISTGQTGTTTSQTGGQRSFADEIASEKITAKFRTFFLDLKESRNGKFIKITEKNNGRRSTIMFDEEDLPAFIEALQNLQKSL